MGGRHKINIVTALLLQREHHGRNLFARDFLSLALVADVEVLTEQTHQIAVGKKYGSRTMAPHQRCFFAEMRAVTGDPGVLSGFTDAGFTCRSIDATFSRAQMTGLCQGVCLLDFLSKQAIFKGFM